MMENEAVDTLVVLTQGKQDRGSRATLAMAWACTVLAMGKTATVYLTMDGAVWARDNAAEGVQVAGFEALSEYIDQFVALGGKMVVCAPCCEYYCSYDRSMIDETLVPGVELVGLSTVVGMIRPETNVVTF